MKMIIKQIKDSSSDYQQIIDKYNLVDKITLEYKDLEVTLKQLDVDDFLDVDLYVDYDVDTKDLIEFFSEDPFNEIPEDIYESDELLDYIGEHFNEIVKKHSDELKDYYEMEAAEWAAEQYEYDPDQFYGR